MYKISIHLPKQDKDLIHDQHQDLKVKDQDQTTVSTCEEHDFPPVFLQ